jgi:hypothetical protein
MAEWGTVSNALVMSTIVKTPPRSLLLRSRVVLKISVLILHPFSFCLIFCTMPLFTLLSRIEEKIRLNNELIVIGRQFSALFKSLLGFGTSVVLFSFRIVTGKIYYIKK